MNGLVSEYSDISQANRVLLSSNDCSSLSVLADFTVNSYYQWNSFCKEYGISLFAVPGDLPNNGYRRGGKIPKCPLSYAVPGVWWCLSEELCYCTGPKAN